MVIDNVDSDKYPELFSDIVSKDWTKVAVLTVPLIPADPIIASLYKRVSQ